MTTMTLPAMARVNAGIIRSALAQPLDGLSRQKRAAPVQICGTIAGLFRGFLDGGNEGLAKGVGSRSLLPRLEEGIEVGGEALRQCAALQDALDRSPDAPGELSAAVRQAVRQIEDVRQALLAMAAWVGSPPPRPDLEKLEEASKGPFVPLKK